MPKEYIEREAAITAIGKPKVTPGGAIFDALKKACQEEVRNLPAADVVAVVRCRDCLHYIKSNVIMNEDLQMVCNYHFKANYHREPDDYCSKGERKDGGQDE